jgi:hypothetical protein
MMKLDGNQATMQWKSAESPKPKKIYMNHSKYKTVLIVLFDIWDNIMVEWAFLVAR